MKAELLHLDNSVMVLRVLLAVALGGALGIEREIDAQPAGFRTHILICLGAALFGLISIHAFAPFEATRNSTDVQIDVTRVASQVVVGVGFLGGGAILKYGASIRGLTTAASMWVAAAVGLGYLGVDIVVDADQGPMLLEANARPGLAIQIANACGLLPRLAAIDAALARPSAARIAEPRAA